MASKKVEDAVETYLRANWTDSLVLTENLEQEIPQDGAPFLTLEFPVSDSDWPGLNGVQWREEGAFRIVLAVPRGEGMGRMRQWGESLANLFRGVDVGGEACCGVPDEPFTDDQASEGLYFIGTMVVPYYRLSPATRGDGGASVPEGANQHIDFMNDRAWSGDEVAIDTLLGSDSNFNGAAGSSGAYDPADLTADGLVPAAPNVAFIGALRTAVLAGATIVIKTKNIDPAAGVYTFGIFSSDAAHGLAFDVGGASINGYGYSSSYSAEVNDILSVTMGELNKAAITLTVVKAAFSGNGSVAQSDGLDGTETGLVACGITGILRAAIQEITVYPPQLDADLPALSALA